MKNAEYLLYPIRTVHHEKNKWWFDPVTYLNILFNFPGYILMELKTCLNCAREVKPDAKVLSDGKSSESSSGWGTTTTTTTMRMSMMIIMIMTPTLEGKTPKSSLFDLTLLFAPSTLHRQYIIIISIAEEQQEIHSNCSTSYVIFLFLFTQIVYIRRQFTLPFGPRTTWPYSWLTSSPNSKSTATFSQSPRAHFPFVINNSHIFRPPAGSYINFNLKVKGLQFFPAASARRAAVSAGRAFPLQ